MADGLDAPIKEAICPKDIVAQPILGLGNGRKIFPAEAEIDGQIRTNLPVVLEEQGIGRGAKVALPIGISAGQRINGHAFEETAGVIGKIQ